MFKHIFTNAFGILVSRILGFVRDMLTASVLGANLYSDIFFVAFKIPNLFRRIFGEGAFTQTFLPAFTRSKSKALFATRLLLGFSVVIFALTLLVQLFPLTATHLIAWGFSDEAKSITAPYVAINFWYLILIFWVTFLSALLHYRHHFATTAFGTALLNIALIVALLLAREKSQALIVTYLSWGVVAGGALQLLAHIAAVRGVRMHRLLIGGVRYFRSKSARVSVEMRAFNRRFLPAMWGNATPQISAFLDTILASFLATGAISYLYYANRVFQLPLALFAIATSVALFPAISRAIKNGNNAHTHIQKAFWFLMFTLSASVLGGVLLAQEIVSLLFERGAFDATARHETAWVLIMYLIGLLPFGLSKLFLLTLYAQQAQHTAAKIATVTLSANMLFSVALMIPYGAAGLALASTIGGFVQFVLVVRFYTWAKFKALFDPKMVLLLVGALGVLALMLWAFKAFVLPH
ncbi:MAG: multidrug transporter MurJ [Sulfuricurvum sp. PC08-66]|nr:MAG: multidrug transporter MurJ [Sulfuricurvum sp. PC08-66]